MTISIRPHPMADIATVSMGEFSFDYPDEDTEAWFWIPARAIRRVVNPLTRPVWYGVFSPIRRQEVLASIMEGRLRHEWVSPAHVTDIPSLEPERSEIIAQTRRMHIERIAAFVVDMPADPITIDVGAPELGFGHATDFIVDDGHHRIGAGLIRGDDLLVTFQGSCDAFRQLFPTARGFYHQREPQLAANP